MAAFNHAMQQGMDFLAITEHDEIKTVMKFLNDCPQLAPHIIPGEEITTRLPGREYDIHVGVYFGDDKAEKQHEEAQKVKGNIMELVDYLKNEDVLHVLNHPFFVPWAKKNCRLTREDMEQLREMFEIVEKRNGLIPEGDNYKAEKFFKEKGAIAGSDCHNGKPGRTYAVAEADDKKEFLQQIKNGRAVMGGEHGSVDNSQRELIDKICSYGGELIWRENGTEMKIPVEGKWAELAEKRIAEFTRRTSSLWAKYHQNMDHGVEEWEI